MQSVVMMGRLCCAPELRRTEGGIAYCGFRLAVDRDYRDGSGERQSDFFSCRAWRGTAEHIARWWVKGQRILCEGRLESRTYTTDAGERRQAITFLVERAHFVGDKQQAAPEAAAEDGGDLLFD